MPYDCSIPPQWEDLARESTVRDGESIYMWDSPLQVHIHSCAGGSCRHGTSADPYKEWWSLKFDPAAESRSHDYLSSLTYMPVMIQVSKTGPDAADMKMPTLLATLLALWETRLDKHGAD